MLILKIRDLFLLYYPAQANPSYRCDCLRFKKKMKQQKSNKN